MSIGDSGRYADNGIFVFCFCHFVLFSFCAYVYLHFPRSISIGNNGGITIRCSILWTLRDICRVHNVRPWFIVKYEWRLH